MQSVTKYILETKNLGLTIEQNENEKEHGTSYVLLIAIIQVIRLQEEA